MGARGCSNSFVLRHFRCKLATRLRASNPEVVENGVPWVAVDDFPRLQSEDASVKISKIRTDSFENQPKGKCLV